MKTLSLKNNYILILLLILIAGFISLSTTKVFASTTLNNVESIINTGILSYEKASLISDTGTEYSVNIYETNDKLTSVNPLTNTKSYVKEYAIVLDKNNMVLRSDLENNNIVPYGSKNDDEWDKTAGVQGFVTIYYDRNGTKHKITSATGYWNNHDGARLTLSNRRAIVSCNDGFFTDQYISRSVASNWNISTGFNKYADSTQGIVSIGAVSTVTITTGGGNSWILNVPCVIAGDFPVINY